MCWAKSLNQLPWFLDVDWLKSTRMLKEGTGSEREREGGEEGDGERETDRETETERIERIERIHTQRNRDNTTDVSKRERPKPPMQRGAHPP